MANHRSHFIFISISFRFQFVADIFVILNHSAKWLPIRRESELTKGIYRGIPYFPLRHGIQRTEIASFQTVANTERNQFWKIITDKERTTTTNLSETTQCFISRNEFMRVLNIIIHSKYFPIDFVFSMAKP